MIFFIPLLTVFSFLLSFLRVNLVITCPLIRILLAYFDTFIYLVHITSWSLFQILLLLFFYFLFTNIILSFFFLLLSVLALLLSCLHVLLIYHHVPVLAFFYLRFIFLRYYLLSLLFSLISFFVKSA